MRQRKFSKVEGGQKGGKLRVFEKRKGGIYKGGHCVTTTVILKHSCKISRECFKFLKTLRNILQIGCVMPQAEGPLNDSEK